MWSRGGWQIWRCTARIGHLTIGSVSIWKFRVSRSASRAEQKTCSEETLTFRWILHGSPRAFLVRDARLLQGEESTFLHSSGDENRPDAGEGASARCRRGESSRFGIEHRWLPAFLSRPSFHSQSPFAPRRPLQPTLQHELEVELLPPPSSAPSYPFTLLTPQASSLSSPPVLHSRGGGSGGAAQMNGAAGGQDWTEYEDVIDRFLNDVRMLIRNAGGAGPGAGGGQ